MLHGKLMILYIVSVVSCLFLVGGFTYMNRVRGSDKKPPFMPSKIAVYAAMSLLLTLTLTATDFELMSGKASLYGYAVSLFGYKPMMGPFLFLGDFLSNFLCFVWGWGKFFPTGWNFTPDGRPLWEEKEFPPAEWVANAVVGKWGREMSTDWVKKWQAVGMSARFGLTFGLIKFPFLGACLGSVVVSISGLFMALAGVVYYSAFKKHTEKSVPLSEYLVGALLGLLSSVAIISRVKKKQGNKKDGAGGS